MQSHALLASLQTPPHFGRAISTCLQQLFFPGKMCFAGVQQLFDSCEMVYASMFTLFYYNRTCSAGMQQLFDFGRVGFTSLRTIFHRKKVNAAGLQRILFCIYNRITLREQQPLPQPLLSIPFWGTNGRHISGQTTLPHPDN